MTFINAVRVVATVDILSLYFDLRYTERNTISYINSYIMYILICKEKTYSEISFHFLILKTAASPAIQGTEIQNIRIIHVFYISLMA